MRKIIILIISVLILNFAFSQDNLVYNMLTVKYENRTTDAITRDTKNSLRRHFINIAHLTIDERIFDDGFYNENFPNEIDIIIKCTVYNIDIAPRLDLSFYCRNTNVSLLSYNILFNNRGEWEYAPRRDGIIEEGILEMVRHNYFYRIQQSCH